MPESARSKKKLSHQELKRLNVTIGFLEGLVRRDPEYVEALQLLGDDYTRRGNYGEGLAVDERLARLRPDDALVHYNLACSYSLTGRFEQGIAALDRALSLGYRDFRWLSRDPDLKKLRAHPLYEHIRARVSKLKVTVR